MASEATERTSLISGEQPSWLRTSPTRDLLQRTAEERRPSLPASSDDSAASSRFGDDESDGVEREERRKRLAAAAEAAQQRQAFRPTSPSTWPLTLALCVVLTIFAFLIVLTMWFSWIGHYPKDGASTRALVSSTALRGTSATDRTSSLLSLAAGASRSRESVKKLAFFEPEIPRERLASP
eukprot:TRINITY_DN11809_c0_g4_i1.p1 TRINITY_DN11809_c0_g4~~TRINITY_DN11809_c0_g4_i1.p1  ORF type:complete len:203 (-),score=47.08 TRINITY_DN11809_c0_g4_i1:345-887(-)